MIEAELADHVIGERLLPLEGFKKRRVGDGRVALWVAGDPDRLDAVIDARQVLEEFCRRAVGAGRLRRVSPDHIEICYAQTVKAPYEVAQGRRISDLPRG